MGKNLEPQIAFRCDRTTIDKLEYIAKQNTRTRNQEMKHIIKQYIDKYEEEHGEIKIPKKPTFKEALEANAEYVKDPNKSVIEKLKGSYKHGFDQGMGN